MKTAIARTYFFTSNSTPGRMYQTQHYADGATSCDCPGWTKRNPPGGRTCPHIRLIHAGLAEQQCVRYIAADGRPPPPPPARGARPIPTLVPTGRRFETDDQ